MADSTQKTIRAQAGGSADPSARFAKDASSTVESLQEDFQAMRDDISKLSEQVVDLLQAKGNAAYKRAKRSVNATAGEAVDAMSEVRDRVSGAIEESVQERPIATLALALGIGFVLGAIWRR